MKLGDGRKVAMHKTPECREHAELHTEYSSLLSDWLALNDEVKMTGTDDPLYAAKLKETRIAHGRLRAKEEALAQHTADHGCWRS